MVRRAVLFSIRHWLQATEVPPTSRRLFAVRAQVDAGFEPSRTSLDKADGLVRLDAVAHKLLPRQDEDVALDALTRSQHDLNEATLDEHWLGAGGVIARTSRYLRLRSTLCEEKRGREMVARSPTLRLTQHDEKLFASSPVRTCRCNAHVIHGQRNSASPSELSVRPNSFVRNQSGDVACLHMK
eukprot:6207350-Pleurochrysis_carterae.AAC.1